MGAVPILPTSRQDLGRGTYYRAHRRRMRQLAAEGLLAAAQGLLAAAQGLLAAAQGLLAAAHRTGVGGGGPKSRARQMRASGPSEHHVVTQRGHHKTAIGAGPTVWTKLKKTQRKKKKKNIWIGEMAAVVGAAVVVGSDEQPWWLAAGQEHMYNLSFVG